MIYLYKVFETNAVGCFNTENGVSQRFTQKTLPKLEKLLGVKHKVLTKKEIDLLKFNN